MEDEKLVALVEQRPALFDKGHPKYSNRHYVKHIWEEIAAEMREEVESTKRRWGYLRDYFQKQYKRALRSKCGLVAPKKRKWRLFDSMMFLADDVLSEDIMPDNKLNTDMDMTTMNNVHQVTKGSTLSTQVPTIHRNEQDTFHRPQVANFTHFSAKTVKTAIPNPEVELPRLSSSRVSSSLYVKDDDNELFLKSLLPMMRTLDPLEAMQFRQETQGLLIRYVKRARAGSMHIPNGTPATLTATSMDVIETDTAVDLLCPVKKEHHTQNRHHVSLSENMADVSPLTSASTSPTPSTSGFVEEEKHDCTILLSL